MYDETRLLKIEGLQINEVADGYVVYEKTKDRVHFLNPVAALIFELCDGSHTVAEMRSILISGYDLSKFPDNEFQVALKTMLAEGLIEGCKVQ